MFFFHKIEGYKQGDQKFFIAASSNCANQNRFQFQSFNEDLHQVCTMDEADLEKQFNAGNYYNLFSLNNVRIVIYF